MASPHTIFLDDDILIGSHCSLQNSRISNTLRRGLHLGMYSIQFYMGSSQSYERTKITANDIKESQEILKKYPMKVFTHSPLSYNLAGSVKQKSLAWRGNSEVDDMMKALTDSLTYEVSVLDQIGGCGTVVHPGCYLCKKGENLGMARDQAIDSIAKTLDLVKFDGQCKVLLENTSGEKGKVCSTMEYMYQIRDRSQNKDHIGYCIDTTHAFGAGLYDCSKKDDIDRMFHDFDKYGKPDLFHLNDSEVPFGALADRHQLIGEGFIWGNSVNGLMYLLAKCKETKIPLVLETSPMDMVKMGLLMGKSDNYST